MCRFRGLPKHHTAEPRGPWPMDRNRHCGQGPLPADTSGTWRASSAALWRILYAESPQREDGICALRPDLWPRRFPRTVAAMRGRLPQCHRGPGLEKEVPSNWQQRPTHLHPLDHMALVPVAKGHLWTWNRRQDIWPASASAGAQHATRRQDNSDL